MKNELVLKIVQLVGFTLAIFLLYRLFTTEGLEKPDYLLLSIVCVIALYLAFVRKRGN